MVPGPIVNVNYVFYAYTPIWIAWEVAYVRAEPGVSRMLVAWAALALAALVFLVVGVDATEWHSDRQFVIMQDVVVIVFWPIVVPCGLLIEWIQEMIDMDALGGPGGIRTVLIGHGLVFYVVIQWAIYTVGSLVQIGVLTGVVNWVRQRSTRKADV